MFGEIDLLKGLAKKVWRKKFGELVYNPIAM